jgi:hypothetical protein
MVNFGLNSASILGIFLAVAGASLYFLRTVRPELSRDHDIFFAAVGLLCGFILLFQGWRLDPILQFGQFLLTGSTIFFAVESIRLRQVATEQARRNTPTVDRERPVSRTRVYREEEDDSDRDRETALRDRNIPGYNAYEGATPNYDSPRLRGYDDPQPRSSRSRSVRDENPRTRNYSTREERYSNVESPRSRRPKNNPSRQDSYQDNYPDNYLDNERDNYDRWSKQDSWDESDYPNSKRPADSKRDRYSEGKDVQNEPNRYNPYNPQDEPRPSTRKPTRNSVDRDKSYRNDRNDNLGRNYDDGLGTSYEEDLDDSYEEDKEDVIVTDYVDYQLQSDRDYDEDDDYEDRGKRD